MNIYLTLTYWTCTATILKPLTGELNNIDHLFTTQCSAGKCITHLNTAADPLMAMTFPDGIGPSPPAGQCTTPHHKNLSGMTRGKRQRAQRANLASKLSWSQSDQAFTGCTGTSQIHGEHNSPWWGTAIKECCCQQGVYLVCNSV